MAVAGGKEVRNLETGWETITEWQNVKNEDHMDTAEPSSKATALNTEAATIFSKFIPLELWVL